MGDSLPTPTPAPAFQIQHKNPLEKSTFQLFNSQISSFPLMHLPETVAQGRPVMLAITFCLGSGSNNRVATSGKRVEKPEESADAFKGNKPETGGGLQ